MVVEDWVKSCRPIREAIPVALHSWVLAEKVVHDCAGVAWRARPEAARNEWAKLGGAGYCPWPMMGTSRAERSARYLWHETYTPEEYRQYGATLGLWLSLDTITEKSGTLVRREGALGDVLCITPILAALRKQYPEGPLDVATACPQALEGNEDVTGTFPPHHGNEGYERVIDLNNAYEESPTLHIVEAYAKRAGIELSDYSVRFGRSVIWTQCKIVVLHCAKSWTSRTIPRETWDAVSAKIVELGFGVCAVGTAADYAPPTATDMRGKMTLTDVKNRIDHSAGFIGSDSGILHLAGATGAPIVGIYTCASHETRQPLRDLTNRFRAVFPALDCYGCLATFPAPVNDLPYCKRGDMACVRSVTPAQIIEAFLAIQ